MEIYDFYGAPEKNEKTLGWMGCIREKDLNAFPGDAVFYKSLPPEYRVEEDIRKIIELENFVSDELVFFTCSWLHSSENEAWSGFPLSKLI